ncbi:MAG: hypothetical protein MSIBF_03615 [Candidatus Altiarchaeales archaeon IMC4]|nr:MAG: hypothetical protein MSIBF_03615 [Candidatus Altiarchaeales archaeon IMC4]
MQDNEYPEAGEFVVGTVKSTFNQGAFITLDEYGGKTGMLHLKEISPKWVRNIHDYVREGQKSVFLVLRVNPSRGHIDLSLRRVAESQKKEKLLEVKQKQRARKLMGVLAEDLSADMKDVEEKIIKPIEQRHGSLYVGLEAIAANPDEVDIALDEAWKKKLVEIVCKNIKPPFVRITGYVDFRSYEPNGVDTIKGALSDAAKYDAGKDVKIDVSYISAPLYRISVTAPDYKSAEKALREAADAGTAYLKKYKGIGEFYRQKPVPAT